jgi:hypothetical protein
MLCLLCFVNCTKTQTPLATLLLLLLLLLP